MILASASPRRKELLSRIESDFSVVPADIDESVRLGESPEEYVKRMAYEKALAIYEKYPDDCVVASDTSVVLNNRIMGKPSNQVEAREMLSY